MPQLFLVLGFRQNLISECTCSIFFVEKMPHTTDPQKHMRGPVSSTMQGIKEEAKKNDKVSKEEADREREKNM